MSSGMTLDDAFEIPESGALSALDFVIRLDSSRQQDALQRLVDDYVITPAVATALPVLFKRMQTTVTRGEAYGHILHGGFGSGKSHLMTMISMLLEGNEVAWGKSNPTFEELSDAHKSWVQDSNLLVVRVHMLSARRGGAALDEILYDAVNATLERNGKPPMLVSGAAEVLKELRAEAETYGEAFWKRADEHGVAGSEEELQIIEEAGAEAIEAVAHAYLAMNNRTMQTSNLKPPWGVGLRRMARHVTGQGYGGLVLLIDEFLLWLAEKAGEDFVSAINDMNTIVDFSGGRRDAPVIVLFARQKNIKEFFPDLTDQDRIQDRIDHHAQRFDVTMLQDVELRYIVRGRVLREQKKPQAIQAAREKVLRDYKRAIDDLVGEAGPEVLKDVFPFHPALIDVLVDVSNLMQRERSALRLIYELLSANRTQPLDALMPVGRVFEHVFPPAGVEAAQKTEMLQKIHREWYQTLSQRLIAFANRQVQEGTPLSDERLYALRQALKTVLLGLVSPRLAGKDNERLTIDRIAKLNFADADGGRLNQKIARLWNDLTAFGIQFAPELQITGDRGAAVISYAIGQASLGEVLRRAESKVNNKHALLTVFGERLSAQLPKGLSDLLGSKDGIRYEVIWRGTKRRGSVLFGNVREMPYASFEPSKGEEFRIVIDYPWDDPGYSPSDDLARLAAVRKSSGQQPSAAWLPRHFTAQELRNLKELAAAQWVVNDGLDGELLASYGRDERSLLHEQARNRAEVLQRQIDGAILEAYDQQSEVKTLIGPRSPDLGTGKVENDLLRIVREILDRSFPQHPDFQRSSDDRRHEASRQNIKRVEAFMRRAWGQTTSIHFDSDTATALERVARPLELANVGQNRAALQHHGRFIKEVNQELGSQSGVAWAPIAEKLRDKPFGLTQDIIDLLLVYVCLCGYRLRTASGDREEPHVGLGAGNYILEKADILSLADWSRARQLAQELLQVSPADAHRSLSAQDLLAQDLSKAARQAQQALTTLSERLASYDARDSKRHEQVSDLLDKLKPLTSSGADSFTALSAWLAAWPKDDSALRAQLLAVNENNDAIGALNRSNRKKLRAARGGALNERIQNVLAELDERLQTYEQLRPLRVKDITTFNDSADQIITELLKATAPQVTPPGVVVPVSPPVVTPPIVDPVVGYSTETTRLSQPSAAELQAVWDKLVALQRAGRLESVVLISQRRDEESS